MPAPRAVQVTSRDAVHRFARAVSLSILCLAPARAASGQAIELGELVPGLGVSARVLVIGAHPDDEDTALLAWLVRGRHVEAAYLSLTRGDGGQNLIGNELGEELGVLRTEELLAARRIDGARQYFTRAYDFGYSKSAEETWRHWPHDSLLRDVVTVVRAFRPHVIVSVFSGTSRDGHGQHQVAGLLSREVFDAAMDTVRFPRSVTAELGPWTPLKFYRSARFSPELATLRFNVGDYSPLHGRSYYEIAAESRSQHKSQGFGVLQRRGVVWNHLRREASRVHAGDDPARERSIFDGMDTTWSRLRPLVAGAAARAAIDSLPAAAAAARAAFDPLRPHHTIPALARVGRLLRRAWCGGAAERCLTDWEYPGLSTAAPTSADAERSLADGLRRVERALLAASGVAVEATADREVLAVGDTARLEIAMYNRAAGEVAHGSVHAIAGDTRRLALSVPSWVPIAPDSVRRYTLTLADLPVTQPWWLARPRQGSLFAVPGRPEAEAVGGGAARIAVLMSIAETPVWAETPLVYRRADPVRGDVQRPLVVAPEITVTLERATEVARAGVAIDRVVRVHLQSAAAEPRDVRLLLRLPAGLTADSAVRSLVLPAHGRRAVDVRLRGRLPAGRHEVLAVAEAGGQRFTEGVTQVAYEHIAPRRIYRPAVLALHAIDVQLPPGRSIAYVPGVGDNIVPVLRQLGFEITVVEPDAIGEARLSSYDVVVIGPRAYEAHEELLAGKAALLEFARSGGTLVVQYGQYEMMQSGVMPYEVTLSRPHRRVAEEDSPVEILRPRHPLLTTPNRITRRDFDGWVQERALYMPVSANDRYTTLLAMSDPGESPLPTAILVAPYGRGMYVYTSLAFFRQLPGAVPGAVRLFVNLLSAGAGGRPEPRIAP